MARDRTRVRASSRGRIGRPTWLCESNQPERARQEGGDCSNSPFRRDHHHACLHLGLTARAARSGSEAHPARGSESAGTEPRPRIEVFDPQSDARHRSRGHPERGGKGYAGDVETFSSGQFRVRAVYRDRGARGTLGGAGARPTAVAWAGRVWALAILGAFFAAAVHAHSAGWVYILLTMLLYSAALLGSLAVVRSCGYRLDSSSETSPHDARIFGSPDGAGS